MKKNYRFNYFILLLLVSIFGSNNLNAQCTVTDPGGCGQVTFTEFSVISSTSGAGTVTDPYIGDVEVCICIDVEEYGEEALNYLHGVFLRNVPGKTYSNIASTGASSGIQAINMPFTGDSEGTHWNWIGYDDGLGTTDYPNHIAAVDGDGLVPFPGFYVTDGLDDFNPRDNFGDPGEGNGPPIEDFVLDPFCFYVLLSAPSDGEDHQWTPNVGISGDGSTGSHIAVSTTCFVSEFVPTCGGSADDDGTIYYNSGVACTPPTNPTGPVCTTPAGAGLPCAVGSSSPGSCGSGNFTDFSVISTHAGAGTEVDPLIGNSVEVRVCYDVETFGEEGLNWLHGVFLRNVPGGSALDNQGSCGDASGVQPVNTPGTGTETDWTWVGYDDGLTEADYPNNIAAADGDGFIPYPGFYVSEGLSDCNSRDNFGDPGEGTGTPATLETYVLEPFCFYVTLVPPADGTPVAWTPNLGVSGDGSTGSHPILAATCFAQDYVPTCGGSDGNGTVYYQGSTTVLPVELMTFTGTNQGKTNLVEWTTATETEMKEHVVEKSTDGENFSVLGSVPAKNNATTTTYSLVDDKPAKLTYYRLRSVGHNGTAKSSATVIVESKVGTVLNVYPIPTSNEVNVNYIAEKEATQVKVILTDFVGRTIQTTFIDVQVGVNNFEMDLNNQASGVYFLSIQDGDQTLTQRLIKK